MIWRRSRTRGWFEDAHRTISRWAKLDTSMDVCSRDTTCVNVQISMLRGWTGRGRAHAVGLQGGPQKWGVYYSSQLILFLSVNIKSKVIKIFDYFSLSLHPWVTIPTSPWYDIVESGRLHSVLNCLRSPLGHGECQLVHGEWFFRWRVRWFFSLTYVSSLTYPP